METLTQVAAASQAESLSLNFLLLFGQTGSGSGQDPITGKANPRRSRMLFSRYTYTLTPFPLSERITGTGIIFRF